MSKNTKKIITSMLYDIINGEMDKVNQKLSEVYEIKFSRLLNEDEAVFKPEPGYRSEGEIEGNAFFKIDDNDIDLYLKLEMVFEEIDVRRKRDYFTIYWLNNFTFREALIYDINNSREYATLDTLDVSFDEFVKNKEKYAQDLYEEFYKELGYEKQQDGTLVREDGKVADINLCRKIIDYTIKIIEKECNKEIEYFKRYLNSEFNDEYMYAVDKETKELADQIIDSWSDG